jgi:Ni/Co efflux regulator RcnB
MKRIGLLALFVAGTLATGAAFAEKPDRSDRQEKKAKSQARAPARPVKTLERHFDDRHRVVVRDYYAGQFQAGRCPPGLAKKRNGCLPPGQAKKWEIGRPLPRDVIFHALPPRVVVELGAPPAGHRFVRVAADILLIAVGTGMVVDAIEDLGRM